MDSKINSCLKRKSEIVKNNKIRLGLLSLTKNELNINIKVINDEFSFSSQTIKENLKQKSEKDVGNTFSNKISGSQKTSNETSDISEVEDSSDLSCEEEEL